MLAGLLLALAVWANKVPILSKAIHQAEDSWTDRIATWVEPAPELDELVFLGIDGASMTLTGLSEEEIAASPALVHFRDQWIWNRRVWAEVIYRLGEAGASQIVFDILLPGPSEDSEADTELAEAIAKYRSKVVLGASWEPSGGEHGGGQTSLVEPDFELLGPEDNETAFGYVNFWPSPDGVVRETIYRLSPREAQMTPGIERLPDEPVFDS
jgi:CHASE2 domain-containing sensor protein